MFFIIDLQTRNLVTRNGFVSRKRAQNKADRLNIEYGAHRYTVVDASGAIIGF